MMNHNSKSLDPDKKRALLAEILKERASKPGRQTLSQGEQRLWRLLQFDPNSAVYNVGFAYDLKGALDVDALEKALRSVTLRHEALRTAYAVIDGVPIRVVAPDSGVRFERIDLSSISEAGFSVETRRLASEISRSRIDLTQPPLWRFTLLERSECDKTFLISTHHIISDRWSVGILVQELAAEYAALVRDEPSPLPRAPRSYSEVIGQLDASMSERELTAHLAYWRAQFGGDVRELILPTESQPIGETGYGGMRRTFILPDGLAAKLGTVAVAENATPYVVFLAALAARLYLDTGQTDQVFITPVSRRHHAASRGVIGYFNNLVPILMNVAERDCFRDLLRSAAQVVRGAFEHQDVPFQQIADQPNLNRIRLGRCLISVQNTTSLALDLPGITSSYYDVPTDTANFDLAVFLEEHEGTYRGWVDAKTDRWTPDAIDQFVERFLALTHMLVEQPDRSLAEFKQEPKAGGSRTFLNNIRTTSPNKDRVAPPAEGPSQHLRNELERQMIGIWEDVMGIRPLGPNSHFFELGGDSLMAARLFDRIGRAIGRELPLAAILQAPNVRELSKLLVAGGDVHLWAILVPLQPHGTKPPLFCVHGGGGGVLTYTRVAGHLGADQPLWGLQAPNRGDVWGQLGVEEIARQYIEAIDSVCPEGPYYLCGHSFGALVAFEMATQLCKQGKPVPLLVLIDQPGPDARISWTDRLAWYGYSLAQLDFKRRVRYIRDRVIWKLMSGNRVPRILKRYAADRYGKNRDAIVADHRLRTLNDAMTAMELYQPGSYPGKLTLFRARSGSPAINTDRHGGWGLAARGGVEVHDFDCDHMQIFDEPTCGELCATLRDCLDRAQQVGETVGTETQNGVAALLSLPQAH
jgi:thioesterase domain-containing protein/acyl carrier protein